MLSSESNKCDGKEKCSVLDCIYSSRGVCTCTDDIHNPKEMLDCISRIEDDDYDFKRGMR